MCIRDSFKSDPQYERLVEELIASIVDFLVHLDQKDRFLSNVNIWPEHTDHSFFTDEQGNLYLRIGEVSEKVDFFFKVFVQMKIFIGSDANLAYLKSFLRQHLPSLLAYSFLTIRTEGKPFTAKTHRRVSKFKDSFIEWSISVSYTHLTLPTTPYV